MDVSGNVSIIGTKGGTTGDIWGYKLKRNAKVELALALGKKISDGYDQK